MSEAGDKISPLNLTVFNNARIELCQKPILNLWKKNHLESSQKGKTLGIFTEKRWLREFEKVRIFFGQKHGAGKAHAPSPPLSSKRT